MTSLPTGTALGIDIGGTGIKGGLVDLATGTMASDRFRIDTPKPATPEAVTDVAAEVANHFDYSGPIGIDFPGVVQHGVVHSAANVDKSWIGTDLVAAMKGKVNGPVTALNDADAAGLAEARYGAAKGNTGLVIMVTFGTGIGIAMLHNGVLVPNAELGHIEIDGHDAETKAAASARERDDLSWEKWAHRAHKYLVTLENLLWPDLFVLGGGISKRPEKWVPLLNTRTPVTVATLVNNAGIVGAALAAAETHGSDLADPALAAVEEDRAAR